MLRRKISFKNILIVPQRRHYTKRENQHLPLHSSFSFSCSVDNFAAAIYGVSLPGCTNSQNFWQKFSSFACLNVYCTRRRSFCIFTEMCLTCDQTEESICPLLWTYRCMLSAQSMFTVQTHAFEDG